MFFPCLYYISNFSTLFPYMFMYHKAILDDVIKLWIITIFDDRYGSIGANTLLSNWAI